MCVCVCVYLFVLCRNPNCWTDCDEIWPGGGPQGREGSWRGAQWSAEPQKVKQFRFGSLKCCNVKILTVV